MKKEIGRLTSHPSPSPFLALPLWHGESQVFLVASLVLIVIKLSLLFVGRYSVVDDNRPEEENAGCTWYCRWQLAGTHAPP